MINISIILLLSLLFYSKGFSGEVLYAGTTNPGKVCEYVGGGSWSEISPGLGFSVTSLIIFEGELYAGVITNSYAYNSQGLIYRYDGYNPSTGEHIWTQVGQLDQQVCELVEFNGDLYAGTAVGSARLYRYDPATESWSLMIDHTSWDGTRAAFVWGDWLYIGDWYNDRFARWNGVTFEDLGNFGGSCIYDLEAYGDFLYGGAYIGAMYRVTYSPSSIARIWYIPDSRYVWALDEFQDRLYIGVDWIGSGAADGQLWKYNRHTDTRELAWSLPVSNSHEGVISLTSDGDFTLYMGIGGQAVGYPYSLSGAGTGQVWAFDGSNYTKISTDGSLGTGVQTLLFGDIGCRISVNAGSDVTRECDNSIVTLQGAASDTCDYDTNLDYAWWEGTSMLGVGPGLTNDFELGTHYITLAVTNSYGTSGKDVVKVDIVDTTPPEIICPPNVTVVADDSALVCVEGSDWPANYTWEEMPFEWESEIGSPLNQSDDDYDYVSLGFDFDFYGTLYSGIYICSNGMIKFNAGSSDYSNSCLPSSESAAQFMVAPLWDDLNPAQGGDVYYKYINVVGLSPSRRFVATWLEVPHYPNLGSNTFQVVLHEETGEIQLNYSELWSGNAATVGVQLNTSYYTAISCNNNPNWPSSILLRPPCVEFAWVEVATNPDIGIAMADDNCDPSVTLSDDAPNIFHLGQTQVTWTAMDWVENQATCTQTVTVVPAMGSICASVKIAGDPASPVQGVITAVIDQNNDPVGFPLPTDEYGEAFFDSILVGEYSVMIVTPLGYSVSPSETQTNIAVIHNECSPVDFVLTPTIVTNDCRTIGYWKHQFNVQTSGRGNAQETSTDLDAYLELVHQHFDVLGIYTDLESFNFEDAKNVLTVRGGSLMLDRARQQLFALLLNFASGRIGNETVISDDGRVAAEAVTLVGNLINDSNPDNDELAKTICDLINNGQMVAAGVIPESPIRYKFELKTLPQTFSISQNYPNPFNAQTTIGFDIPKASHVRLTIFNMLGQVVDVLVDNYMQPGTKSVSWNAGKVSSGMYFYRLEAESFDEIRKMTLLK